jgi:hypothetical protein
MEQTVNASGEQTEYLHVKSSADIPFAHMTHRQFVPFAQPHCEILKKRT